MDNDLKIVAISDTHSSTTQFQQLVKNNVKGDIFIHAGDFTKKGTSEGFYSFFQWLQRLEFKHKIVIAGNHEASLDNKMNPEKKIQYLEKHPCSLSREKIVNELRKRAIYLENDIVEVEGLKIFGSPYTPKYGTGAFQYNKEDDQKVWDFHPQHVDLLLTHGPPFGILDTNRKGEHSGSKALLNLVERVKPKVHIFGHIHQGRGCIVNSGITFRNVAKEYQIFNWN